MKITVCCPTMNRPELLGRAIACFEHQTYENRELVIVDDVGQYENQSGDRWQLISLPRRVRTLGEKDNLCMALASSDSDAVARMDDDDVYMPWWLEALADALSRHELVQPRKAIDFRKGRWTQVETFNRRDPRHFAYHGCWGFRRELIERTGGYRPVYALDDHEFDHRLKAAGVTSIGVDEDKYKPFYWYNRPLTERISERGHSRAAYEQPGLNVPYVGRVPPWTGEPVWNRNIPAEIVARWW